LLSRITLEFDFNEETKTKSTQFAYTYKGWAEMYGFKSKVKTLKYSECLFSIRAADNAVRSGIKEEDRK
jgi:hypothetical protein